MLLQTLIIIAFVTVAGWLYIKYQLPKRRRKNTIAFFHLNCSAGGGGERVLWQMVESIFKKYPNYTIYIYSHKNIQGDTLEILQKVRDLFKIDLISNRNMIDKLEFVQLRYSTWVEAKRYPIATLFFQNFMSMFVALEATCKIVPEIYFETIGTTFTLPVFKLFKCKIITYVHYPIISTDMINNVRDSTSSSFNNRSIFVNFMTLRMIKLFYYKILAYLYGMAGQQADLVMVNSSWTQNHIEFLWKRKANVVYPPCDVDSFKEASTIKDGNKIGLNIISIGQFREEKKHEEQIEAFDLFLSQSQLYESNLTLYGSCRNEADQMRVHMLKDIVRRLKLESNVNIVVGASFERLLEGVREADVAIHTMKDEHFGIVLPEFMAAGLIIIAHNSGGPKTDIIDDKLNGFLASDEIDFAKKLIGISKMKAQERIEMQGNAMKKAEKFSSKNFEEKFITLMDQFLLDKKK